MSPRVTAELRWLRAVVVAGLAGGLGAGAHVAAGGRLPSAPVVLVVVASLVLVTAAALGRPASCRRLAVLVGGGQAAVHACLTATAGHGAAAAHHHAVAPPQPTLTGSVGAPGPRRVNALDQLAAATPGEALGTPGVPGSSTGLSHVGQHLLADLTGTTLLMTLLHLAAAAAVAAWLFAGEQALWSLVVLLGTWLGARLAPTPYAVPTGPHPAHRRPELAATPAGPRRERRFAATGPSGRRGPPCRRTTLATSTA